MKNPSRKFRPWAVALLLALPCAAPAGAAVDQWSQIGPFGGQAMAVVFHPGDARVAFAATYTNGVFRSTDGGASWTPANIGLPSRNVASLAISAGPPVTLYAGAGRLSKSTDGGLTWTATGLEQVVYDVAVSPARPATVVVTTGDNRIRRSDDGGATWRDLPRPPVNSFVADFLALDPRTPDTLYLGIAGDSSSPERGLYRSTDAGATWIRLDTGLAETELSLNRYAVAAAPDRPDTLYASAVDSAIPRATSVARSTDGGATWTLLAGPGSHPVLALPGGRVVTDRAVSTDFGDTWLPHSPPTQRTAALAAHPTRPQDVLLAAEYRGIFRSEDGGSTWNPSSEGMTATRIEALAVGADSTLYAAATGDGLFASGDRGGAWEHLDTPAQSIDDFTWIKKLAVHPRRPRLLYAGIESNAGELLARTDDGGATWTDLGRLPNHFGVADLAFDPTAPATLFAAGRGASAGDGCKSFRSNDRGSSWRCLRLGQALNLETDPADPRNLYATNVRLSKSTDRGNSWTMQGYGRGLPGSSTPMVLVHAPGASGHLYLSTDRGSVFRSTDGGRNWRDVTGNLPRAPFKSLAVDPRNPAVVYAALSGVGVYRSKDGGRRWQLLNRGLSGELLTGFFGQPTPIAVDPRDPSTVYVGTHSRGVFAITLTD